MRKVVTNQEVPHLWAHQAQPEARNSTESFYFNGDTIYSYRNSYPIARHVFNAHGEHAVLFATWRYSVTSSGHQSATRRAIPANVPVFEVPRIDPEDHHVNIADYVERISTRIAQGARARTEFNITWHLREARELHEEALRYAQFFSLPTPSLPEVPEMTAEALAALRERERKVQAAKAQRTREENQRAVEEWLSGERASLPYGLPTMLRLSRDGQEVETSKGARVPVSHARRLLDFVRELRAQGREYRRNGHTWHVGHYAVDWIEANGTLHAGCHVIAYSEIERFAVELEKVAA